MQTPVKTFTAKEMHNAPGDVFREVDRNGYAQINHAHYPDKMFIVTAREKNRLKLGVKNEQ